MDFKPKIQLEKKGFLKFQQAIRERAQRAAAVRKSHTIHDTVTHSKRFAETAFGGITSIGPGSARPPTNPIVAPALVMGLVDCGGEASTTTSGLLPSAVICPLLRSRTTEEDKITDLGSGSQVTFYLLNRSIRNFLLFIKK